jgi:CheY-like chemotaxis protein
MQIFLVDDDEIFNYLNTAVINHTDEHIQVKAFRSGEELLSYISDNRETIIYPDIMFVDMRMPNIDGFELLEILRKDENKPFAHTKIYMLSSTLDHRDLERAKQIPMIKDFLSKPLTTEMLKGILIS